MRERIVGSVVKTADTCSRTPEVRETALLLHANKITETTHVEDVHGLRNTLVSSNVRENGCTEDRMLFIVDAIVKSSMGAYDFIVVGGKSIISRML
jgi:hypothetical protein